ncbi:MAG: DUF167 domain-containing protein [Betaproteobacteria bacterium]|nr:DUF167 domain-containing protein [Betaproteobacteria bacterium]
MTDWVRPHDFGAELEIHVQPGASKSDVAGLHGDALKVRIQARAVDGAANAALTEYLAQRLGLPRTGVTIRRGEKSRRKTVLVALPAEAVRLKLLGEGAE